MDTVILLAGVAIVLDWIVQIRRYTRCEHEWFRYHRYTNLQTRECWKCGKADKTYGVFN